MAQLTEEVLVKLNDQFTDAAKKIDGSVKMLSGSFAALAGFAGLGAIALGVKKTVEAFAEQEKVQTQLSFALRSFGVTARSVTEDYVNFAKQLSRTSMFQDEEITQVETLFTQYGLYGDQLKRTTRAAIDLATATGTDLSSAAFLFAKATQGQYQALQRSGILIDQTKVATQGFNAVLEASESKFKGFGEAALNTTAGSLNQFKKGIEDMEKAVGALFAGLDKRYGATKGATKFFQELADGVEAINEPILSLQMKVRDLNEEKALLETKVKFGFEEAFKEVDIKKIDDITKQISALEGQIKKMNEDAGGTTKSSALTKAILPKPEEVEKAKKYIDDITAKYAEGFEKIDLTRQKDLNELEKYHKKGTLAEADYQRGLVAIQEKSLKDTIKLAADRAAAGFDAIGALSKGNISGFVGSIQSMLPPAVGAVVGMAKSAVGAITSIFSMFDSDTRTATKKTLDYINQMDAGFKRAQSNLKALMDENSKRLSGNVGSFDLGQTAADEGKTVQQLYGEITDGLGHRGNPISMVGLRIERDPVTGDIFIMGKKGNEISYMRGDTGKVGVYQNFTNASESESAEITKRLIAMFKAGKLPPGGALHEYAYGGMVPGSGAMDNVPAMLTPGEFVVSKKGVNKNTIGLLRRLNTGSGSQGHQMTINLSAIDGQSVARLLKETIAPMMREMSGRNGVVFLNEKGVSSNI